MYRIHHTFEEMGREALDSLWSLADDMPHLNFRLTIDTDRNNGFEVERPFFG